MRPRSDDAELWITCVLLGGVLAIVVGLVVTFAISFR
jgi:hypothetical protein